MSAEPLPVTDLRFPVALAIGIVRAKGWRIFPGHYFTSDDRCCPLGAIIIASGLPPDENSALETLTVITGIDEYEIRGFTEAFDSAGDSEYEPGGAMEDLGVMFRHALSMGRL